MAVWLREGEVGQGRSRRWKEVKVNDSRGREVGERGEVMDSRGGEAL